MLDGLAAVTAPDAGPVPDLGPAALPDQLAVLVQEADLAGVDPQRLETSLVELRKSL